MSQHTHSLPYRVLLYYKYVTIDNPIEESKNHLELCLSLELKGRILFASEGINVVLLNKQMNICE